MSLVTELQRRNVFRVAAAYLVVGWLLTEVLTAILPTLGAPVWVANAVIWIFALGFIPMLVLAWVFEVTADGLKTQESLDKEGHVRQRKGSKLDYVTVAGIVIIVVFAGFFGASRTNDDAEIDDGYIDPQSVAVLPFVNMSNDPDNAYFSDGLTESLLNDLANMRELKVAARTSSFAFKGRNIDVREIAATLKVAHVLEGSVQRAGNTVRVTAQLIRAEDGFHVWSESYDRELDDIFRIQDDIAGQVGGALSATLLGTNDPVEAPRKTESLTAYDLYLLARAERVNYSFGGLEAAEKYLKAALRVDPQYIQAKNELATNYIYQQATGLMARDDAFAMAGALSDQVLAEEPNDVLARAINLFLSASPEAVRADADTIFGIIDQLRAIVLEHPEEYEARALLATLLEVVQRFDEALSLQLTALEDEPYNARIWFEVGVLHLRIGDLEEAKFALNRSLELEPKQPNAHAQLANVAMATGDGVEYLKQMLEAMRDDRRDYEMPALIAAFLYRLELTEQADDFRNLVLTAAPTSDRAYLLDLLRAVATEDDDLALAAARRAIEDDVGNRGGAFQIALSQLILIGRRQDTLDEQLVWLADNVPDLLNSDAPDLPIKYRMAQSNLIDAWYVTESPEELRRRVGVILGHVESFGINPMEHPMARVTINAINGNEEAAIQVALDEVFTDPVTSHLDFRMMLGMSFLETVTSDDRVQAALEQWETDESKLRRDVARFLAEFGEYTG